MAVAFDVNATPVANNTTAGSGTLTSTALVTTASATLVIGVYTCSCANGSTLNTASSATYNSVAMTLIGHAASTDSLSNVYIFGIVGFATGSHTGQVTFSGGSGTLNNFFDCFSFKGTDTSSVANAVPAANVITDQTTSSTTLYPSSVVNVTTANGDAACGAANDQQITLGAPSAGNGTVINNDTSTNVNYVSAYHLSVGATTTLQFTAGSGTAAPCCGVFFRIKQPGGGDVLASQIWI